jgi:maltooligosyltrehalose trehalohydrolase
LDHLEKEPSYFSPAEFTMGCRSLFGTFPRPHGVDFYLWASKPKKVQLLLGDRRFDPIDRQDGIFHFFVVGAKAGERYSYVVEDKDIVPDPASRFQPEGVHGPSEIIDSRTFPWTDGLWKGLALRDLIFYELHVGTFTPEGTFKALQKKLPYLKDLGITALELMPLADFPGNRNWGYDGVSLYAPARCYGRPEDLRCLVNEAHRLGLSVFFDVVYNHLGPDGSYIPVLSPEIFSNRHKNAWGASINLDGKDSSHVRRFLIDHALSQIREYHLDGLRLDATHALIDESPKSFLAELSETIAHSQFSRPVHLIAEDARNLARIVRPPKLNGWGLGAVWADDFHHQVRRALSGDHQGYYQDYSGTPEAILKTTRQGWFYTGQTSAYLGRPRGTDPTGLKPENFVYCLQNHDQIGNRAFGERLHHQADPAAYRAALTLLLTLPYLPLLFMGQEWGASTPFLFFTDHQAKLGETVREGRREEFKAFSEFQNPVDRLWIPDPQDEKTFMDSRLKWEEILRSGHSQILALTHSLLRLRREDPTFRAENPIWSIDLHGPEGFLILREKDSLKKAILVLLKGSGDFYLETKTASEMPKTIFTTEDVEFSPDPRPIEKIPIPGRVIYRFQRPGACVMDLTPASHSSVGSA